jgi:formylglycine-generating enzyme required for sulfatase activity
MAGKHALLIGISTYGEGLQPIPSATKDLEAMKEVLLDPELGGFPYDQVQVLINPGRMEMEMAIESFYVNKDLDDLVLLYFSGHGFRQDDRQLLLSTSQTRKMSWEGRTSLQRSTTISAKDVRAYMDESRSRRQVVILDCCFSAAFTAGMTLKKDEGKLSIEDLLGGKGRAVLTSSDAIEESQAGDEDHVSLSVYTRFLVEGIRTGAADKDGKGWLSPRDLHRYTSQRVGDLTNKMTPQFIHTEDGDSIRIFRVRRDPKNIYLKKVKELVEKQAGVITAAGRAILENLREDLKLDLETIERIESKALQLSPEYVAKLDRYRATVLATLNARRSPKRFTPEDLEELQELELRLRLRPSDVASIYTDLASHASLLFEENQNQPGSSGQTTRSLSQAEPEQPAEAEYQVCSKLPKTRCWLVQDNNRWIKMQENLIVPCYMVDLGEQIAITMIQIPSGEFLMGSPEKEPERLDSESPQHPVKLRGFFLSHTPVTQAQWRIVAGWPIVNRELNPEPSRFKGPNRPVECVSWEESMEFCRRLSAREQWDYTLPTEEQWEYACRARTTEPFSFGTTLTTQIANYNGKYSYDSGPTGIFLQHTTEVACFEANAWGLHDMHGNVWEWCLDSWHDDYRLNQHYRGFSLRKGGNKVMRGGSWGSDPSKCRSASRQKCDAEHGHHYAGFRVCTHSKIEMDFERDLERYSIPVTC